jgi:hypothetical protein
MIRNFAGLSRVVRRGDYPYLMQNETVFYAAVSSDGFLAGPNGDMTWAEKWLGTGEDFGYFKLVSSCSAMLMGSKTFDFELAAIGNQDRILPTYVLTTNPQRYDGVHGDVKLVAGDVSAVVDRITDASPGRPPVRRRRGRRRQAVARSRQARRGGVDHNS